MLTIRSIFLYLDRTHVLSSTSARSLFDMGLQLLGRHLKDKPEVHHTHPTNRRTHCVNVADAKSAFDSFLPLLPNHQVGAHAVKGLLALVDRERRGEVVDRRLVQSLLRMLHNLGTYAEAFQRPFLEESDRFYRLEGGTKMVEVPVPEYLKHCEVRCDTAIGDCTR